MLQKVSAGKLTFNLIFLSLFTCILASLNLREIENESGISQINPMIFANLALILMALSASTAQQKINISVVMFWSFEYIFFGFTLFSIAIDSNPLYLNSLKFSKYFDISISIVFVSHLLVLLAQFFTFNSRFEDLSRRTVQKFDANGIQRFKKAFYFYYLCIPFLLVQLGGIDFLFRRTRSSLISADYSSPLYSMAEALLYVTPVLLTLFVEQQRRLGIAILTKYKLYFLYGTLLILSNPFANARQTTILILFPFIYKLIHANYHRLMIFLYSLLFSSFFLANVVDRQTGKLNGLFFEPPSRLGDYDAFGQLMNTLEFIDIDGISFLKQFTGSVFFFIPRSFWNSKPVDSGVLIADFNGLAFQNLSCPWIAEAILNFGILGFFVVSIFMSLWLKRLDPKSESNYVLSAFVSSMLFILLRGSLLQATGKLAYGMLFIFVISRLCLPKQKKL
jgi:hypothetical protein